MQLENLLDQARENCAAKSDRELSRALKLCPTAVGGYRTGRSFPSDQTIVNIAILADQDPLECLLALNLWRTRGTAHAIYADLSQRLGYEAA